MVDLRVPIDKINATICFDRDQKITGTIFLGLKQWEVSRANKVRAFLEDDKQFVPFLIDGTKNAELINKKNIKTLEWVELSDKDTDEFVSIMHSESICAVFIDGENVCGTLLADLPTERSRLSDCLNTSDKFLHIISDKRHTHINKRMLLKVTGT